MNQNEFAKNKPRHQHTGWAFTNRLDPNNIDMSLNQALEAGSEDWREFRIYRKYAVPRNTESLTSEEADVQERHRGKRQQCYYNSQLAVFDDDRLTYVEGVYTNKAIDYHPIPHAWVELNGKVLDLTLPPEDRGDAIYYGVPFKREDVLSILTVERVSRPIAVGPSRPKKQRMAEDNRLRRIESGA